MCTPVMPYRPGFFNVDRALNSYFMIVITDGAPQYLACFCAITHIQDVPKYKGLLLTSLQINNKYITIK